MPGRRSRSPRTVVDDPSLVERINRALYRLQNTQGLPLQALGDSSDPEIVLHDCSATLQRICGAVRELRAAIIEQVGDDQTDRLRRALTEANDA